MTLKIALAGNPNSGKTTMFNDLTGSSQYVGNWPGVTVEKKEGRLKGHKDVLLQDLPGIYSLSPYSPEEMVTRNYLITERPDAIINIVDASNIERNLYLTTQLTELGIPVIVALNMIDVVRKHGDVIDLPKLGRALGCTVVETSALKGIGSQEVAQKAVELASAGIYTEPPHVFGGAVEHAIAHIEESIEGLVPATGLRWYAIKLFERDEKVKAELRLNDELAAHLEEHIRDCEAELGDDSESIVINERYEYIGKVVAGAVQKYHPGALSASDKVDRIVTNRVLALPIFAGVMFLVYWLAMSAVGGVASDWMNDVLFGEIVPVGVTNWLLAVGCADWLRALIVDGVIAGVGAVLGFLPQLMVLFLCLAVLEQCGYMARIAFILDRVFRKFGLSGKSIIPMMIATGCAVPGIMASRTIESESDRRMTVITTSFIPCGAKIPIIALIAGAMFGSATWVAFSAYFLGIAAIVMSGVILKKSRGFSGESSPFVMELPPYHLPSPTGALRHMWDRSRAFIIKAGTIILVACIIIWFLSSFNWRMVMVPAEQSMLAAIGNLIAPLFAPLGWGEWQAAVATLTGLIAKENVVATFGVLYGLESVAEDGAEIWGALQAAYTGLAAYSFLMFNLLCAPCFAAIGAIRNEMGSPRWTWIALGYQTGLAYALALVTYQAGMLLSGHGFNLGTAAAALVALLLLYLLLRPQPRQPEMNLTIGH